MGSKPPLFWLRWGAAALIAALCLGDIVEHSSSYNSLHRIAICGLYACYAVLFLRNTNRYPRRSGQHIFLLIAQLAISAPLESNLSVVTAATIPLVIERRRWKAWISWTLGLVILQLLVRNGLRIYLSPAALPAEATAPTIAIAFISGIFELIGWHLFAFLAAILIVRFDEDRRRLALLNAELKGAQVLLTDSGRLAERLRISRELHDSLGHHLTSLSLQLEIAEHLPDDQLKPKLAQVRLIARLLLTDIREAVSEWRSETSTALPGALRSLANAVPGVVITFDMDSELPAIAPSINHALFRCAQEALTNAIRHGFAAAVNLRVRHVGETLALEISDNGVGCSKVIAGNGIASMSTRVAELGGEIRFDSVPGKGFNVAIQVPAPSAALL